MKDVYVAAAKVAEVRRGNASKEKRGEEEQCSVSKKNHQSQEESLAVQQKIKKKWEGFTSVLGEKKDEKRKKRVSKSGEDSLHGDSVKEIDECSSSGGGADQNMNGKESQRRQQHCAWDTLGTLLAESVSLRQDDVIRDQTVDDGGKNDGIVHLEDRESDLSDGDEEEEENASEKVEPLEWMFTRREVEKGTIEIVYRWPNQF